MISSQTEMFRKIRVRIANAWKWENEGGRGAKARERGGKRKRDDGKQLTKRKAPARKACHPDAHPDATYIGPMTSTSRRDSARDTEQCKRFIITGSHKQSQTKHKPSVHRSCLIISPSFIFSHARVEAQARRTRTTGVARHPARSQFLGGEQ